MNGFEIELQGISSFGRVWLGTVPGSFLLRKADPPPKLDLSRAFAAQLQPPAGYFCSPQEPIAGRFKHD